MARPEPGIAGWQEQMAGRSHSPRYFTLEQAEAQLPRLRQILPALQAKVHELRAAQRELASAGSAAQTNSPTVNGYGRRLHEALSHVEALAMEIRRLLHELDEIGCELKDVETGLVDFRTVREGREVYLCWRLGEETIGFWHELDAGFAGRQPL